MTTADDLLRRALEAYDHKEEPYFERLHHAFEEIRAYLDAPKDEPKPVAWIEFEEDGDPFFSCRKYGTPVYLHPPTKIEAKKPMTREQILAGLEGWDWHPDRDAGFYAGIRFAEKFHGIGGWDE